MLLAGCGIADITPEPGIPLSGFAVRQNKPSLAVDDPLQVKALALVDHSILTLLISYDLLALDAGIVETIHHKLEESFPDQYARKRAVILATHTHSGPPTMPIAGETRVPDSYIERLAGATCLAAQSALDHLAPAELYHASARVDGLTYNRRLGLRFPEKVAGKDPLDWEDKGPLDDSVDLFVFKDLEGQAVACMLRFACHGVTMLTQNISADFPGELARRVGLMLGTPCIYLQGAAGDINPVIHMKDHDAMLGFVDRIMEQLSGLPGRFIKTSSASLRTISACIDLEFAPFPEKAQVEEIISRNDRILAGDFVSPDLQALIQEYYGWRYEYTEGEFQSIVLHWAEVYKEAALRTLHAIESPSASQAVPFPITIWQLGPFPFVFLSGEILTLVGEAIQALAPEQSVQVVGYRSPVAGYITGKEDYQAGGYEPRGAWMWYRQPGPFREDAGERIVAKVGDMFNSMKGESKREC
ncbi:MAG: neutral/alkaline non-lysosomal ceramidase N-terminal domain-containing protein [Omnitrophica WOR_2 bacterium]